MRERYGRHAYGQRALLARRLVEAGCTFVTMVMENPMPGEPLPSDVSYNWDSHAVNCHIFDDAKVRLPLYDQAVTALIEDLYARGLDRKVLLVVTGEFGRTPRISYSDGHGHRRDAARPRSLAEGDVDARLRRRHAHRADRRRDQRQGRASRRAAPHAQRPVGDACCTTWASTPSTPSPTWPAARCRSCPSASRSANCCR